MPSYTFRASVGGDTIVQVEAPDRDKALEAASVYIADDWNSAATLKASDVQLDEIDGPEELEVVGDPDTRLRYLATEDVYSEVKSPPAPAMLPGQTPYSPGELKQVNALVSDAAAGDPGELGEALG